MTKKKPAQQAITLAQALLYHCKKIGNWELDISSNKPAQNLLEILSSHPDFQNIFEFDTAYSILNAVLKQFESQQQTTFNHTDAKQLLTELRDMLSASAARHWIVVPLRKAKLSANIRFQDFVFITGSRDEKIDTLRRLSQISQREAISRAEHTESTRSPAFFDHPLLAIKIIHQTIYVDRIARLYALWAICLLQVIYWGYIYSDESDEQRYFFFKATTDSRECRHLAIWAKESWRYNNQPLKFRTGCEFDLDWLNQRSHKKRFTNLFRSIVVEHNMNDLAYRFFKALRFFGKAIDSEENREAFEGIGITLIYLMTIAEGVLLNNDSKKRRRLTVLLPRLAKLPGYTLSQCDFAVDSTYRWRSEFVHAGDDRHRDWDEDLSEGIVTHNSRLVKRMVARLLSDAPNHVKKMLDKTNGDHSKLSDQWFEFLRKQWDETLGLP